MFRPIMFDVEYVHNLFGNVYFEIKYNEDRLIQNFRLMMRRSQQSEIRYTVFYVVII